MPTFVASQIGKGTVLQAPTADGTVGQFLKTDGAGNLSFDTVAASPSGSDTQIQFNDGGAFGGSANLTWDDATLQVTGTSTTAPTLVAKLPASATANAFEVQDSTSATTAYIDQNSKLWLSDLSNPSRYVELYQSGATCVLNFATNNGLGSFRYGNGERISFSSSYTKVTGDLLVASDDARIVGQGNNPPSGSGVNIEAGTASASQAGGVVNITCGTASGTDIAQTTDMYIKGPRATGNEAGGSIILQTGTSGASGATANTLTTVFELSGDSKMGFFGATPVGQQSTTGTTTGFSAGSGTSANDDSTYTGNTGSTAYTVSDIVLALKNLGLIAA